MKNIPRFLKTSTQLISITSLAFLTTQCGEETTIKPQTEEARSKVARAKGFRETQGQGLEQTHSSIPLAPEDWAGKDPEDIAEQLKADGDWHSEKGAFYKSWGVFDPQAAMAHVEGGERNSMTGLKASVMQGWASSDIIGAKEWISKQPQNVVRSHFVTQAILATRSDKDEVARNPELESWLVNEKDTPGIKQSIRVYVNPLLEKDFEGTMEWISSGLEKGTLREGVACSMMKHSAPQSRAQLRGNITNWMTNAPAGDFRDEMIYAYVQENSKVDAEASLSWARIIKDEDLKESAVKLCKSMQ